MTGQPIDTCPKDGSEFLAYDPVAGKFDVCRDYDDGYGCQSTQQNLEWGPFESDFQASRATLWWPLPTP